MNRNQLYWLLGVVVLVGVLAWIASYATPMAPVPSGSVSTTTPPSSPGKTTASGGVATPNPGASTSSAPYQTELLQLGTTLTSNGVKATPLSVVEDSRCPEDVQCIQAGTVKVNVKFVFDGYSTTRVFILGKPQSAFGYTAELTDVRPSKKEGITISPNDYRFLFTISKP